MEQAPKETPSSDKKEVEVPVNVSRRDFLKGAGVGMVGAIAGVGVVGAAEPTEEPVRGPLTKEQREAIEEFVTKTFKYVQDLKPFKKDISSIALIVQREEMNYRGDTFVSREALKSFKEEIAIALNKIELLENYLADIGISVAKKDMDTLRKQKQLFSEEANSLSEKSKHLSENPLYFKYRTLALGFREA